MDHRTATRLAASTGNEEIVLALFVVSASPGHRDINGNDVLFAAASKDN